MNSIGQIRVGTRKYDRNGGYVDPKYKDFIPIRVLTKSSEYGELGPYIVCNENGVIFENLWQFSKIYKKVPRSIQRYSRYDKTVIWDHPAEIHMDEDDNPTDDYWKWRQKGFDCKYAIRYPVGMYHRSNCICSLHEYKEHHYNELDYIEARKEIYLKEYHKCIKDLPRYDDLKKMLEEKKNLLIIEVDGPHQESMGYYKEKYDVKDDFIVNDTILVTKENMKIMINDEKHPFGHGYCLALSLLGIIDDVIN